MGRVKRYYREAVIREIWVDSGEPSQRVLPKILTKVLQDWQPISVISLLSRREMKDELCQEADWRKRNPDAVQQVSRLLYAAVVSGIRLLDVKGSPLFVDDEECVD